MPKERCEMGDKSNQCKKCMVGLAGLHSCLVHQFSRTIDRRLLAITKFSIIQQSDCAVMRLMCPTQVSKKHNHMVDGRLPIDGRIHSHAIRTSDRAPSRNPVVNETSGEIGKSINLEEGRYGVEEDEDTITHIIALLISQAFIVICCAQGGDTVATGHVTDNLVTWHIRNRMWIWAIYWKSHSVTKFCSDEKLAVSHMSNKVLEGEITMKISRLLFQLLNSVWGILMAVICQQTIGTDTSYGGIGERRTVDELTRIACLHLIGQYRTNHSSGARTMVRWFHWGVQTAVVCRDGFGRGGQRACIGHVSKCESRGTSRWGKSQGLRGANNSDIRTEKVNRRMSSFAKNPFNTTTDLQTKLTGRQQQLSNLQVAESRPELGVSQVKQTKDHVDRILEDKQHKRHPNFSQHPSIPSVRQILSVSDFSPLRIKHDEQRLFWQSFSYHINSSKKPVEVMMNEIAFLSALEMQHRRAIHALQRYDFSTKCQTQTKCTIAIPVADEEDGPHKEMDYGSPRYLVV
ncbi:hypothetical protein CLF_112612 [Clonorchis sinensis]|uniref:Uncharacterized protein n=1 Tax=Clonorchis sinensis TaxID=79923 RepID=G7YWN2_CLOSI|nr:hypothetical protein CLF_112612 [Clonorchis sinensis]